MRPSRPQKFTFISVISTLLAVALLASFTLHAVQISHDHHSHAGGDTKEIPAKSVPGADFVVLGEYMHLSDKKLFLIIAIAGMLAVILPQFGDSFARLIAYYRRFSLILRTQITSKPKSLFNYLRLLFAKGILNPKLY